MEKKITALLLGVVLCCGMALPTWADYQIWISEPVMTLDYDDLYAYAMIHFGAVDSGVHFKGYAYAHNGYTPIYVLIYKSDLDGSNRELIAVNRSNVSGLGPAHAPDTGFDFVAPVTAVGTYMFTIVFETTVDDDKSDARTWSSLQLTVSEVTPTPTPTPTVTPTATPDVTATPEPESTITPEPTATPTPYPHGVGREDLEGTETVLDDAQGLLDTIYDILPKLSPGVLGFMGGLNTVYPWWFNVAFGLGLTLGIALILVRFMWK